MTDEMKRRQVIDPAVAALMNRQDERESDARLSKSDRAKKTKAKKKAESRLPGRVNLDLPLGLKKKIFDLADSERIPASQIVAFFNSGADRATALNLVPAIPPDLEDAAWIDGANTLQLIWFVILPLALPALATVTILTFQSTWNDCLPPLIYLQNRQLYTVTLGLQFFRTTYTTNWSYLMAASLVTMLPVVAVFFAAQRLFIEGITLLASTRLCPNVPAQHAIQAALGGHQTIDDLVAPGGRLLVGQREFPPMPDRLHAEEDEVRGTGDPDDLVGDTGHAQHSSQAEGDTDDQHGRAERIDHDHVRQ